MQGKELLEILEKNVHLNLDEEDLNIFLISHDVVNDVISAEIFFELIRETRTTRKIRKFRIKILYSKDQNATIALAMVGKKIETLHSRKNVELQNIKPTIKIMTDLAKSIIN
jgi:hypothetical protein